MTDLPEAGPALSPPEEAPQIKKEQKKGKGVDKDEWDPIWDNVKYTPEQLAEINGKPDAYSRQIYYCFQACPNPDGILALKQIYRWFSLFTFREKNSNGGQGWKNSIRHNLSMNDVSRPSTR